ncbi:class I SAM-dependent methyltransferase [Acaryochloris sp. IP29b_bin.137]|uniref:class I SAM-dependent DNA methyltransferase n=1 Tax=Acaryochloris sp. IP29b_bin.137 TaxID=2969217 RepID=UPI002638F23F|nr:class I SAM-dependent methyltransferase [Acaryochloris sp. IP29b_bin.137]
MTDRYTDYNNWAWLYNETVGPDYSQPQLNLLKRVFLPHIPDQGRILDLCCGTGQLIQPLVNAGYQVTGLDGSEEMLTYARQNAPQATYLLEDARQFESETAFDGAFSTSASLNHLMSLTDLRQVFERVYATLKSGSLFVFDLNHPGQLKRWWRGQPTEGEIRRRYAWMITPHYDPQNTEGAFIVKIYQAGHPPEGLGQILSFLRRLLYKILSHPRFIGLRLKLLQNFNRFEPHWQQLTLTYPIKGHSIDAVKDTLAQVGFTNIDLQTIDGHSEIDNNHSAHFICTKPSSVSLTNASTQANNSIA